MDRAGWKEKFENAGGRLYSSAVYSVNDAKEHLYGFFGAQLARDRFAMSMRSDGWKVKSSCAHVMGTKQYQIDADRLKEATGK